MWNECNLKYKLRLQTTNIMIRLVTIITFVSKFKKVILICHRNPIAIITHYNITNIIICYRKCAHNYGLFKV